MKYDYMGSGNLNESRCITIQDKHERPVIKFQVADIVLSVAMLVLGFLYCNMIQINVLGAGVTIFTVTLCAVTLLYFKKAGIKQTRKTMVWLGLIALSSVYFTLFDGYVERIFNFLFLSVAFIYWVCLSTGRQLDQKISIYIIGDMINQGFVVPFSNFSGCICGLKEITAKNKHGRSIFSVVIGIIIFLPILFAVVQLLTSVDMAFDALVTRLFNMISIGNLFPYILEFIIGIPVAFYLYGLLYGNKTGRHADKIQKSSIDQLAATLSFAPKLTIYGAMTAFNLIYMTFFFAQASYLFSAFSDHLPETMTYAEYARRGFFELCTVAGINLAVMTVSYLFIKKEAGEADGAIKIPKTLRVETAVLCIFTMLLIVTAISKMAMYIEGFGLTQLRVYTTWFMVLLFFIFAIVLIRQVKKFNASRMIVIGFIILFMGLCYGNTDGMITKYNIERYEAGTLEFVDDVALYKLSDAAAPYLYDAYQKSDDPAVKELIFTRLTGARVWEGNMEFSTVPYQIDFRSYNLQNSRAESIRKELLKEAGVSI